MPRNTQLLALDLKTLAHLTDDLISKMSHARARVLLPCSLAPGIELGLCAPVLHSAAHSVFDELRRRLAFAEHGLQVRAQFRVDAHLRKDG